MENNKLVNLDALDKIAKELRRKALIDINQQEEEIEKVRDMFGGKSFRYVLQEEYDNLSEEEKNDPGIVWNIIDAEEPISKEYVDEEVAKINDMLQQMDEGFKAELNKKSDMLNYIDYTLNGVETYNNLEKVIGKESDAAYTINKSINLTIGTICSIEVKFSDNTNLLLQGKVAPLVFNDKQMNCIQITGGGPSLIMIFVIDKAKYSINVNDGTGVPEPNDNASSLLIVHPNANNVISLTITKPTVFEINNSFFTDYRFVNDAEKESWNNKADRSELFSKDYNDLINTPEIPSIDDLINNTFDSLATEDKTIVGAINELNMETVKTEDVYEDLDIVLEEHDVVNRLGDLENSMNKIISDDNIEVSLSNNSTVYPYEFESENDGYIEIELQGNTKILDNNGNETSSGNINATLVSSSEISVNVNGKSKIVKYYNNEGNLITLNNLCKFDDYVNTIEKHDDGKYYYHERCIQINLGSVNTLYSQSAQNQVEGFFACYMTPNQAKELAYAIPHSTVLCDKLQCKGSWSSSSKLQEELVALHATSSLNIRLSNDKATNVDEALAWLQENNPCVIAKLNEERVYECISLDSDIFEGTNELNIVCNGILPNVTYTVKNGMVNIIESISSKINTIDIEDINSKLNLLNNLNYIYSNRTILLSDLEQDTDISSIVNEALLLENVDRVVLPVGWYNVGSTIEIPQNKILQLQGDYYLYSMTEFEISNSRKKETVLTLTKDNIAMIKMHNNSTLEGGYLKLNTRNNCQAIRLDFWEEAHSNTKVKGTKIKGTRTYNQTAVLMECDPDDGVTKDGYGVYCDFDISISTVNIGYHLHRQNATWSDRPGDIVWMTESYFRGWLVHCNRYVWFDTVGGWAGDSSIIDATIQGGAIVGEDTPGIELNCDQVRIIGKLWDFGGDGLQQTAIKLNGKSRRCFILGESNRSSSIDNGTGNIFLEDMGKETYDVGTNIVTAYNNSFIGNVDRLHISLIVKYLDGNQEIIENIKDLPFDSFYGYHINGVSNIERLFEPIKNINFYTSYATVKKTLVDSIEIIVNFNALSRLKDVGFVVSELNVPENVSIFAAKSVNGAITEYQIYSKSFLSDDFNNVNTCEGYHAFIQNIDEWYMLDPNNNNLLSKSQSVTCVKWVIDIANGPYDSSDVRLGNLILNVTGINPNFNNNYHIHARNSIDVKYLDGESIFGEKKVDYNFANLNTEDTPLESIFILDRDFSNNGGGVEINDGKLNVICPTTTSDDLSLALQNIQSEDFIIYDIEVNFNRANAVYYLGGCMGYRIIGSGRHLLAGVGSDISKFNMVSFRRPLEEGEYVRLNRIVVYSSVNNDVYLPEVIDNLYNYYNF